MYETLGIAMDLDGRSKSDIERAVMSACDFSTTADQLMLIANYLSHIGMDSRSLDVYRQVTKLPGLHPEAYALGLKAAQRAKDESGIRWATVGILGNSWPTEQQEIYDTAFRVAKALLEKLEAANDPGAAEYKSQLQMALSRDVVIKVSWTGDADIDLIVEEPGGTTCSLQQPRTTGGGVCSGDVANQDAENKATPLSEKYQNAQAFAGTYRARLRKIYGDVEAGKVIVDVFKHLWYGKQVHERQHLAVRDDSDVMVVFELEDGRRTQSLQVQEVEVALKRQEADEPVGPGPAIGSFSDPRIGAGIGSGGRSWFGSPFGIEWSTWSRRISARYSDVARTAFKCWPQGVVSADRRYVRITSSPSFTGIGDVSTFSFASQVQSANSRRRRRNLTALSWLIA